MKPIRRELICRSAATVIAERGYAGTTMVLVAAQAGVSTGMLNHYFESRADMLEQSLVYVSERTHARVAAAMEGLAPGRGRLEAFLGAMLPTDTESIEAWRVWIASYGESVRSQPLAQAIEGRLGPWYQLLDHALEGLEGGHATTIPLSWQVEAMLDGLCIQLLAADSSLTLDDIARTIVAFAVAA
jgi:TetR/AcrR family transcriptional regulator, transcriptional repressor of bet genes